MQRDDPGLRVMLAVVLWTLRIVALLFLAFAAYQIYDGYWFPGLIWVGIAIVVATPPDRDPAVLWKARRIGR